MFHIAIAEATHNDMFALIMNLISDFLTQSREATLRIPGQPVKTLEDHRKIFEAIVNKNEIEAANLIKEHILKAKKNIIRIASENYSSLIK